MIPAKKLTAETETPQEQAQEKFDNKNKKTQHFVKLLIIMLLTYVIIFL